MASREETLLFLVDVQVKGSQALRQLSRDFAAMQAENDRHMIALNDAANRQLTQGSGAGATPGGAGPVVVDQQGRARDPSTGRYLPGKIVVQMAAPAGNQPTTGGSGSSIVGVRSSHAPGSRMNPIVTVAESGSAGGLGSLAAGAPNQSAAGGGPSATDIANAVAAQTPNAGGIDQQSLDQAMKDVVVKVIAPENDRVIQAVQTSTEAQHRVAQAITGGTSGPSVAQDAANRQAMAQALADALESRRAQMPQPPRTMTTGDAAQVLGRSRTQVRDMASMGQIPGAQKQQGQWMLPEDQVEKMLEDIENAKTGGGGAGGGGKPPVALGAGGGGAGRGGAGSRFQWSPFGGSRSNPDSGVGGALSFGNLFKGDGGRGGAFGLPGFGSIGSLGGLGLEHWILSALGVGASATSAIGGASLLGSASITKSIVGGGADALVNKTTITDAKNYQTQLSALNQAIAVYGKGSTQAAAAQYALNQTMKDMGGPADVTAIKSLDEQVQDLRVSFDQASAAARVSSAEIDLQVVGLAQSYVPAVTQAAQRNLALINTAIKPLFTWLEGPQGMGIFRSMENSFATGLPTTIHAASMAIEDFLRLMQAALPYTGGLSQDLDNFFTSKNKEDASAYDAEVQKLVGDLREWENLLKLLGQDMSLVFKQDAGTANAIVGSLTQMLQKLHDWETSSTGQQDLKTIFAVHKQQILELLTVFGHLAGDYGHFYTAVAPAMVTAVTDIAKVFNALAGALEKIPGGGEFAGLLIVMTKLGALGPALKLTAAAMFGIDAAEKASGGGGGGITKLLGGGGARAATTGAEDAAGAAEGGGAVASGGIIKAILAKVGGTTAGKAVGGGVEAGTLAIAGGAEGAGLEGLAASLTTVGAALAPLAAGLVPLLAAAGGVAGLIVLFKAFSGTDPGSKVASNVAHALGVSPGATSNLVKPIDAAHNAVAPAAQADVLPTGRGAALLPGGLPAPTPAMIEASQKQYSVAGKNAATDFVNAVNGVKFPSTLQVFEEMKAELGKLPPQARDTAAQTMLEFTQELQSQGKLPKGAVSSMIQLIEQQFPALRSFLKKEGLNDGQSFASSLSLTEAVSNTKSAVQNLKQEFGNIFDNATTSSGNMLTQVTKDFSTLKGNMGSLTKAGQQQASQNLAQLKQTALSDATAMEQQVSNKMGILANNIASGSQSALTSATGDFSALASNIATAIGSGALAAGKGDQLIAEAMNDQLKALGAKPIPMVALKSLSVKQLLGEQHFITHGGPSNAGHGATAATGALLQIGARGQAGGDNVPLRVGNTNVVVGAGEQVAVINRHQQPIIDRALAKEGYAGLPGLFSSVKTPNYMASGGFVPGYAKGGNVWQVRTSAEESASGDGWTELSTNGYGAAASGHSQTANTVTGAGLDFATLGREYPHGTLLNIAANGRHGTFPLTDIGDGSSFAPAIGLTPAVQAALGGMPSTADISMTDGSNIDLASGFGTLVSGSGGGGGGAGGSGASWQDMSAPKVTGTGAIADIVNAALGKATTAANAYGQKQAALLAPAVTVPGAAGMPNFPIAKGPVPAVVQRAKDLANLIVSKHLPYVYGGYGLDDSGLDCSGFVSTVLAAVGLVPGHEVSGYFEQWGEPGPGKWITTGALGAYSGPTGHVMMEIDGTYYESGGHTSAGPHIDSGWSSPFTSYRHPTGYDTGGMIGSPQHQPTLADLAKMQLGPKAAAAPKLSSAEQAFIKKNKGKPKHGKAPKHKGPKLTAPGKPKAQTPSTSGPGIIGGDGPFPFNDATDLNNIDQMLNAIYGIAGGADGIPGNGNIMGLEGDISYYTSAWGAGIASPPYPNAAGSFFGSFSSPSDFVTSTTDSAGNTTYAIDPNINTVAGQLAQMIGWQSGIVGDLTGANAQAGALAPLSGAGGPINKAIERRKAEIKKITDRVSANAKKIADYQAKVKAAKAKIKTAQHKQAALQKQIAQAQAKQPPYSNPKTKAEKKANATFKKTQGLLIAGLAGQLPMLQSEIDGYQKQIKTWTGDVSPLEAENVTLGGSKDKMGTGGEYGTIFGQLGAPASGTSGIGLAEGSGQGASGLYDLLSTVQSWQSAIGGTNGDLAQQQLTLQEWNTDYGALIPGANSALAADNLANVAAATNSTSPITGTVAFQFNGNEVLASTLQGMAQGGLLPWAGSFMTGGVIPGPIGASALAEVHGGEVITNPYLPGAGSGDSGLSSAMSQLTNALCDHKAAVMQNTTAMKSNTTAVSSTTGGGAGVRYSGGAYSQHTSSDSIVGVGIGS